MIQNHRHSGFFVDARVHYSVPTYLSFIKKLAVVIIILFSALNFKTLAFRS